MELYSLLRSNGAHYAFTVETHCSYIASTNVYVKSTKVKQNLTDRNVVKVSAECKSMINAVITHSSSSYIDDQHDVAFLLNSHLLELLEGHSGLVSKVSIQIQLLDDYNYEANGYSR